MKEWQGTLMGMAEKAGIPLEEGQALQLLAYTEKMLEVNQHINMTRIVEPMDVLNKHLLDSLAPLRFDLIPAGARLLDIGTGAGFPGIPLAICRPDVQVTLLDSVGKKVRFVSETAADLGIRVQAHHGRVEDLGHDKQYRNSFQVVTARAVSHLATLSEYMLPLLTIEGIGIAYKGAEVQTEVEESQYALKILGGQMVQEHTYALENGDNRKLFIVKKRVGTSKKYPRRSGLPEKMPILPQIP